MIAFMIAGEQVAFDPELVASIRADGWKVERRSQHDEYICWKDSPRMEADFAGVDLDAGTLAFKVQPWKDCVYLHLSRLNLERLLDALMPLNRPEP